MRSPLAERSANAYFPFIADASERRLEQQVTIPKSFSYQYGLSATRLMAYALAALAGAIGGGLGMLAGGMLHERNVSEVKKRQLLVREARVVSENQREIDAMRENLAESTRWGGGEVKPWNERYWGESYDTPYEGRFDPH